MYVRYTIQYTMYTILTYCILREYCIPCTVKFKVKLPIQHHGRNYSGWKQSYAPWMVSQYNKLNLACTVGLCSASNLTLRLVSGPRYSTRLCLVLYWWSTPFMLDYVHSTPWFHGMLGILRTRLNSVYQILSPSPSKRAGNEATSRWTLVTQ